MMSYMLDLISVVYLTISIICAASNPLKNSYSSIHTQTWITGSKRRGRLD